MEKLYTLMSLLLAVFWVAGCSENETPVPEVSEDHSQQAQTTAEPSSIRPDQSIWMTDFEEAKAKAADSGKDLLMDFSGSDWCYWCQRLDDEVFSKQGFIDKASEDFVFVKIDFPSDKSHQSRQLQEQNQRLARIYGIEGYPTIILAHPDGTPYAQTGYIEGGPDVYLEHLQELRQDR